MTRPFVDFYRDNAISPVHQDILDMAPHFERRNSLYQTMGIPSLFIGGRDVIEFGPGSGHNALHTASLNPRSYTLVDGNPFGLGEAKKLLAEHMPAANVQYVESMIEDYTGEPADFVICEGTLPFQRDPAALTRRVASFARRGGLVMITTIDDVSYLSESLRKLACECIASPALPLSERLDILRPLLATHMATLAGMTRPLDDWIWDNILQPLARGTFSIPTAIAALGDEFDFYGASPSFVADWRWYKEMHGANKRFDERAIHAYRRSVINFLDCRVDPLGPMPPGLGDDIVEVCGVVVDIVLGQAAEETPLVRAQRVVAPLLRLRDLIEPVSTITVAALDEAIAMFSTGNFERFAMPNAFQSFFGRAQQHVTFVRR